MVIEISHRFYASHIGIRRRNGKCTCVFHCSHLLDWVVGVVSKLCWALWPAIVLTQCRYKSLTGALYSLFDSNKIILNILKIGMHVNGNLRSPTKGYLFRLARQRISRLAVIIHPGYDRKYRLPIHDPCYRNKSSKIYCSNTARHLNASLIQRGHSTGRQARQLLHESSPRKNGQHAM